MTTARPSLRCWFATPVMLMIVGAVCMSEIDRLVTGALTPAGESRSVTDVVGLGVLGGRDTWDVWLQVDDRRSVALWIALHALFDIALYAGYFWLLRSFVSGTPQAKKALNLLLVLEITETVGLGLASALLAGGDVWPVVSWGLSIVATGKWFTGGFLILAILVDDGLRGRLKVRGTFLAKALKKQRLSFAVVAIFGTLSIVPLPNIWDQLPDVQRSWVDGDHDGQVHALWAAVATAAVSVYLFVLGRQRSERVWTERTGDSLPPAEKPWPWPGWLVAAAVPWIVAAVSGPLHIGVDLQLVIVASAFPAAVFLLSLLVISRGPVAALPAESSGTVYGKRLARHVWVVGDLLAASLWVLAGFGLVRSLVAPVVLGDEGQDQAFVWSIWFDLKLLPVWWIRLLVLVGGIVVAIGALPLIVLATRWLTPHGSGTPLDKLRLFLDPRTPAQTGTVGTIVGIVLCGICAGSLLLLILFPSEISQELGVVATTLFALGAWAFILGFMIVRLQRAAPPPVFRKAGLRATPVLTLLLALTLVASRAGGDADLHAVRADDQAGAAQLGDLQRDTLRVAFAKWLTRSKACDVPIGSTMVRPMVLVAASGGGIRAAVWTAGVMDTFRAGACARDAVFLSSGVSGGSVGLALSRGGGIATPRIDDAKLLAGPESLSAAVAGLFAGDLVAGGTGLRLPAYEDPGFGWRDRAGHMEAFWEKKIGSLAASYDTTVSGPAGVLVMNSAAAGRGCRVFISQVDLTTGLEQHPTGTDADRANCSGQTDQPAASIDLQSSYGGCLGTMSWATAAMLSARFPTVTPGGRVSCGGDKQHPDLQLVDGGYAEASGLGTLADIAPALLQVVREHNATHPNTAPVVPVVLFLEDAARGDIVSRPQGLSTEILVPLAGLNARSVQTSSGTLLQRLATGLAEPCPAAAAPDCVAAVRALRGKVPHGIVIAAPLTKPSVEAPLGWTLSADSISRLESAVGTQATSDCAPSTPESAATVRPGAYVCLHQLLGVLR